MNGVEVCLLGPTEVRRDGAPIRISGGPQRVVLARLALSPGRVVSATELIDTLWPSEPPPNALANLRGYVSKLRRQVGAELVEGSAGGYRLTIDRAHVDIGQVEDLVSSAHAVRATDLGVASAHLADALERWRGEPFSDLPDALAFAPELARLTEWRAGLREEWLGLRIDGGDGAGAIADLEAAVRESPDREGLHRLLMQALHQAGRTPEALRVADAFRRGLVEASGLDPSAAFTELEARILSGDVELDIAEAQASSRRTPRRRAPDDRFVGRSDELEALSRAAAEPGLTTVVGPGGVGKTRLLLELLDRDPAVRSASLVELAGVASTEDVGAALAAGLGLRFTQTDAATAIADLFGADAVVLALDNCEHVLEALRGVVRDLLARCPHLTILATSRRRFRVSGERVVRLGPLAADEQVELFFERAQPLRPDLDRSERTRAVAADVCALVDGLPLGVELAAHRESVFGLAQLRERLTAGVDVIEPSGEEGARGVATMVEWSYRLLDPVAQELFDRLAVFRERFTLDAVESVCPPGGSGPALLAELVEASLVVASVDEDGEARFRLFDTMRHVALAHTKPETRQAADAAHANWMVARAEQIHELQTQRSPEAPLILRREARDLGAALEWLLDAGDARAGRLAAIVGLAMVDDPSIELLDQVRTLAPRLDDTDGTTKGLLAFAAGTGAWIEGNDESSARLTSLSITLLASDDFVWAPRIVRASNSLFRGERAEVEAEAEKLLADGHAPQWVRATGVCCAVFATLFAGDRDAAERWMERERALLFKASQHDGMVAYTRGELAAGKDPRAALTWFDEAYRRSDEQGHAYNCSIAAVGRLAVLVRLGEHDRAVAACLDTLEQLHALGMWPQIWTALRISAELLVALGDPEAAAFILAAAEADPLASAVTGPDVDRYAELHAVIDAALDAGTQVAARMDGEVGGRLLALQRAREALTRPA